jgi:diguanylate cyclase (GGDEF)-like protein
MRDVSDDEERLTYRESPVEFRALFRILTDNADPRHLRLAALWLVGVAIIPYASFFLASGRPVFIAVALNMLLVSAAIVYILRVYSRDLANMIDFQRELIETQQETKRLSDVNLRLANLDSLTDLPNRRQFFATLHQLLDRLKRENRRFVLGLIDLDGFKAVNDLYGHAAGDMVLIEASKRMRGVCDEAIFLSRLGGDEFGVIVDADLDAAAIHLLGDRICKVLEAPFAVQGVLAEISSSIGFAAFPDAGSDVGRLFECVDHALYHAKQHLRGRSVIFSAEHETELRKSANVEQCLRHADLQSEMSLHFQPIVNVERGKIVAFEALARWDSPILGKVAPDEFIRVAERSDLINQLTRTLLRRALAEANKWPSAIRVSFNLSMRDLASSEAILNIVAIITNSGVSPDRIDLEVTETAMTRDFDQSRKSLQALKALGVGISLDDFGTGYSSLSYVQQFPIDKIKIDRSFINDVETKPSCRAIIKSVNALCRNLKLICVVEGVETDNQVRVLRALGCTTMQGYLFGKPMPASQVLGFLEATDLPPYLANTEVSALAS